MTRWGRIRNVALAVSLALAFSLPAADRASGVSFWTTKAPMPLARGGVRAGVVNGIVYVVGHTNRLDAYDPVTNTWTTKAPMPTARDHVGVGVVNGILYAVGGNIPGQSMALATVEAYDPSANAWTTKASLPAARTLLAVAATGGILYAMDGVNASRQTVPTVEAYDPSTNSWSAKASSPSAHQAGVAGVINGTVFLYGGFLNGQLEAYDPASNTWITRAPNAQQHPLGAAGVVTDFFYALGGLDPKTGNHTDSNAVEDYLSLTNTWAPAPSMPTARDGLAAAVVNGILYAIGGGSIALNAELPTNEAFVNFTLYTNLAVRLEINVRRRSIRAESRVTLAPGAKFSPLRETVSFQAGDFAVSIPPGAFRQRGSREFVYKAIVHRTPVEVTIHELGKSGYRIGIEAVRVAGLPTRNPIRFELILGGNSGGTNVQARHVTD